MDHVERPWRIELLGRLRATQGEQSLTHFRTHKTGLLLAYLAYYPQRAHSREELIELLWPECDPAAGRNGLRVALSALRHQLEPGPHAPRRRGAVLVADHAVVQLNPAAVTTDVAEFEAALAAAHGRRGALSDAQRVERLTEAVGLYQELLPGYFEDWVLPERQRLAEAHLQALGQLSTLLEAASDLPHAIAWARRAVGADPLSEEQQARLIRLLAAAGAPAAALRQYWEVERLLELAWDVTPGPELRALARALERLSTTAALPDIMSPEVLTDERRPETDRCRPVHRRGLGRRRAHLEAVM